MYQYMYHINIASKIRISLIIIKTYKGLSKYDLSDSLLLELILTFLNSQVFLHLTWVNANLSITKILSGRSLVQVLQGDLLDNNDTNELSQSSLSWHLPSQPLRSHFPHPLILLLLFFFSILNKTKLDKTCYLRSTLSSQINNQIDIGIYSSLYLLHTYI